jgi:hypothetical protein
MSYSPKVLALFVALQPEIREAMGKWEYGDKGYSDLHDTFGAYIGETPFKLKLLQDIDGYKFADVEDLIIRLPLVCDDSSEEAHKRSLWGMVDWDLFSTLGVRDGEMYIIGMNDRHTKGFCTEWQSPTDALLLALASQWGVEVGK